MTTVEEGMDVRRAGRLASPTAGNSETGVEHRVDEPDVLIIGGGAAGLTAAVSLADSGLDVVLLDERSAAGGQYYKQPVNSERLHSSLAGDRQIGEGSALVKRANASGARVLAKTEVWGAFAPNDFLVLSDGHTMTFRPKRTIVATGAYERGLPVPGWTLPGVMTSGAAQTMLKSHGELPGQRLLVCGNGPLNLQVALELVNAGANVVAVTEMAPSIYTRPGDALNMLWRGPALSLRGLATVLALKSANVPVLFSQALESVEASNEGLRAWIGPLDGATVRRDRSFDVDVVCMGFGFHPNNEILRNLGCRHDFDKRRGQLVVARNDECETSIPGIYAAGDCCGLREEKAARRRLRRHSGFQSALWRMFSAPLLQAELANDETIICRCENVRLGQIRQAMTDGDESIGAIKRRTRLGMGACQGRFCAPIAADLVAKQTGTDIGEYSFFAPRVPIKPTRISDIVGAARSDQS
jgi:thioredoxin reductase